MDKLHTHYDNLKVTRNAPVEVIRAAYRAMAQKYHPDLNPSSAANNTMRLLNEAWEVLSNPAKRAEHDKWIAEEEVRRKKLPPVNAETSNKQVFQNGDFKFHFHKAPVRREAFIKSRESPHQQGTFGAKKEDESALVMLNTWLGRKDIKIKAAAIVITILCGGLVWLAIDDHRNKKALDEINALTGASAGERPSDQQVIEGKPLKIIPLPEFPEKNSTKKEGPLDSSILARPKQSKNKDFVDPERQEITGYLKGAYQEAPTGLSNFTVDNQRGGGDAIARIYFNGVKPAVRSMYIKAGEQFTARGLQPGSYAFRYRFVGSKKTYEADRLFALEETPTAEGTRFSNMTVTLFAVRDGNLRTKEVPAEEF